MLCVVIIGPSVITLYSILNITYLHATSMVNLISITIGLIFTLIKSVDSQIKYLPNN